eukprot:COSAG02_NODE_12776_length_1496_cov_1.524696_1_plen_137_part_00
MHQRVDDMLMYPVPLNNIKGYSLDVSTESHAIATLDKLRNKNCLLLAIIAGALAALCFLVGQFEDHPDFVVAGRSLCFLCDSDLVATGTDFCNISDMDSLFLLTDGGNSTDDPNLQQHVTNFAASFIEWRWWTFGG